MDSIIQNAIEYYISIGYRWGLLSKLINLQYGTTYSSTQLQKEYAKGQNKTPSPAEAKDG